MFLTSSCTNYLPLTAYKSIIDQVLTTRLLFFRIIGPHDGINPEIKYKQGLREIFKTKLASVCTLKGRAETMFRLPEDSDFATVQVVIRKFVPAYMDTNVNNVDELGGSRVGQLDDLEEAQLQDLDEDIEEDGQVVNNERVNDMLTDSSESELDAESDREESDVSDVD